MMGMKNRGDFEDDKSEDEFEWLITKVRKFLLKEHNPDGTHRVPTAANAVMPVGACVPYTGPAESVPRGWTLADGGQLNRATYQTYYDLVGVTYGVGDGVNTFNKPDLRRRFPMGIAASGVGSTLGAVAGQFDHTHTVDAHTHTVSATGTTGSESGTELVDNGNIVAQANVADESHTHTVTVTGVTAASAGVGTGTANPPLIALNYIIYVGV